MIAGWVTVRPVTVWETIAVFVLIPLAIYGVLALLTLRQRFANKARYRPGGGWDYEPMWWTGNPAGIGEHPESSEHAGRASPAGPARPAQPSVGSTARGGARGNW
jgi:hypothetical protein